MTTTTVTQTPIGDSAPEFPQRDRFLSLICEGRCNPQIAEADRLSSQYVPESRKPFYRFDEMVVLQRSLIYTAHAVGLDDTKATCTVCGKGRQYGGNPALGGHVWGRSSSSSEQ